MAQSLADTNFFIHGESEIVADSLSRYMGARGARVTGLGRLEEMRPPEDAENILMVHYSPTAGLAAKLPRLKKDHSALRVLLLHEFTDRGKIEGAVLSATDQLLEKPFTQANLEKVLNQFRFRPLSGKSVFIAEMPGDNIASSLMKALGATVVERLPGEPQKLPFELAVFSPAALDAGFRETLSGFRAHYADVPVFMLYDAAAPGVLDSEILNEIAYLVQKPVERRLLREKFLQYFDQPQRDRRKNPRKKGISQIWISAFNSELGAPELFESPYLIDLSQSGLSFQSYMEYREGSMMSVWIIAENHPEKIIDLKGVIRWRREEGQQVSAGALFKYGVEFEKQDSSAYHNFARMVAMHTG